MYNHNRNQSTIVTTLRIATFMVFAGRAWQHLFWDAPYRTLFWDQAWMEGIASTITGLDWQSYATSLATDAFIRWLIIFSGCFYALCAVLSLLIDGKSKAWMGRILLLGSTGLTFLAFLYMKEKYFHVGQFFEYSAQIASPVFLYLMVRHQPDLRTLLRWVNTVIAITFICHGLYAIGYYPRPGFFVDMVINSLGVTESVAHKILEIAAILDFIAAALLLLPQTQRTALWYMFLWGLLTSLARPIAQVGADFFLTDMHRWLPEFIFRAPHFLLPLTALYLQKQKADHYYAIANDPDTVSA